LPQYWSISGMNGRDCSFPSRSSVARISASAFTATNSPDFRFSGSSSAEIIFVHPILAASARSPTRTTNDFVVGVTEAMPKTDRPRNWDHEVAFQDQFSVEDERSDRARAGACELPPTPGRYDTDANRDVCC
jgi:hypothetical protein